MMLPELPAVDFRPALVDGAVGLPVEVQFPPVGLPRRDDRRHVRVFGVSVDGVDDGCFREGFPPVLRDHLFDLLVAHFLVEGVCQPVEGSLFPFLRLSFSGIGRRKSMSTENRQAGKQSRLPDRFLKAKPQFKSYKFDMAADVHERLEKLMKETGMTKESVNDALNYAVRTLVTRLEREARLGAGGNGKKI